MSNNKFKPFKKESHGAESPFVARSADGKQSAVCVLNQFGQVIDAKSRRLVEFEVAEAGPVEAEPAPAP